MKHAKTYEEQLEILIKRRLYIDDNEKAIQALSNINYYNLTGYLFKFKDREGNFSEGVSFEQGLALYNFDREIHSFLSSVLTEIEQSLKTKLAYSIAMAFPEEPCIYEQESFFKNKEDHQFFMSKFKKSVRQNSRVDFVKHHINKYDEHFPIWVAVQLFTLGNMKVLYSNSPARVRKSVSKIYGVSPIFMDSWINCIRILRNLTAHNMRLYGSTFYIMPKSINGKVDRSNSNQLWGYFLLLKFLYHDKEAWIDKTVQLRKIFSKYSKFIDLKELGFPQNWFLKLADNNRKQLKYKGKIE